jgi:myosin regulatory light chain 12
MMDDLLNSRPGTHARLPSMATESEEGKDNGVNFTMFLTMMGEHLFEFDTEVDLIEAFESFDEADTGMVKSSEFRKWLAESGDRMDDREVSTLLVDLKSTLIVLQIDRLLKGPFTDRQGNFNYREWVKVLRINEEDEESKP